VLCLKSKLRFVVSIKPGVRIGEKKDDRKTNHNPNIISGVVYSKKTGDVVGLIDVEPFLNITAVVSLEDIFSYLLENLIMKN
jgi:hypothetical protein